MDNRLIKLLIPLFLLSVIGVGVFALQPKHTQEPQVSLAAPIATPAASQDLTAGSPDGKMTLTLKRTKMNSGVVWTVLVDGSELFSQTLPLGTDLSIPDNTFSPDNKYAFLKETSASQTSYLVFQTGVSNAQIVEISSLFGQKYPNYKIMDVTGWGGLSLIVVNTDKVASGPEGLRPGGDGGQGPSFWFDAAGHSFIQLSDRFN